jgi:hypothetical protein
MLVYTLAITKEEEEKPENKFEINKSFFSSALLFICKAKLLSGLLMNYYVCMFVTC